MPPRIRALVLVEVVLFTAVCALLAVGSAHARPGWVPSFDEGKRLYVVPAGYNPPGIGSAQLERLQAALKTLKFPLYVVLAEAPLAVAGPPEVRAQAMSDELAATWGPEGAELDTSSFFVVTFEPRAYSMLAGVRWKVEFGLERAALDPFIERFLERTRGTPSDPIGGVMALAHAFDDALFDRTDPGRIAAREARAARATLMWILAGVAALLLLVGLWMLRRAMLRKALLRDFDLDLDILADKVRNAAGRYVEFYGKRDAVVGLLEMKGKTAELLEQVTREVDAIYLAVRAMEDHLDRCREAARGGGFLSLDSVTRAREALAGSFEFDTGIVNERDLFAPPTRRITYNPQSLERELEERFGASVDGWRHLEAAAELRFSDPAALFPHSGLDALIARCDAAGIPHGWLNDHPLFGDDESDRQVYAVADALRWTDALGYEEHINGLRGIEAEIATRVDALVGMRERCAAARTSLETVVLGKDELDTTSLDPSDDPRVAERSATLALSAFEAKLLSACEVSAGSAPRDATNPGRTPSLDELHQRLEEVEARYREALERRRQLREALDGVRPLLESDAPAMIARTEALAAELREMVEAGARVHLSLSGGAMDRIDAVLGEAKRTVAEARAAASLGRTVTAHRGGRRAMELAAAVALQASQTMVMLAALDTAKHTYEAKVASLATVRRRRMQAIASLGEVANLAEPTLPPIAEPADYISALREVDTILEGWEEVERAAHRRYQVRELERREHEARERHERERSADLAMDVLGVALRVGFSILTSSSRSSSSRSSSGSSSGGSSSSSGGWGGGGSSSRGGRW